MRVSVDVECEQPSSESKQPAPITPTVAADMATAIAEQPVTTGKAQAPEQQSTKLAPLAKDE
jgi:hypothetical protein